MTKLRKTKNPSVNYVRKKNGILYLRASHNGVRAPERSTGIRVEKEYWDSKAQRITRNDRQSQLDNLKLDQLRARIFDAQYELERKGETVTARKLLDPVFNQKAFNNYLDEVFAQHMAELMATKTRSPRTHQAYAKYFRNISAFLEEKGHKRPLLDDISKELYQELILWLKAKYVQDYAVKNAQFLRSLLTYAQANGLISRNPLTTIRLEKSGHYDTTHLSMEQVNRLANYPFDDDHIPDATRKALEEERDVFIFSSMTGLHHSDFTKGDYSVTIYKGRKWLTGYRVKSKAGRKDKKYSMPLHPLALAIIEKYGGVANLPKRNNAKRNVLLKQIAALVGLKVHLTTKIARKTLASYCLNDLGMRLETVAAVLGHSSTKFVRHYAQISDEAIDREMKF